MDTKKIFKAAMTLAVVFVLILLLYHCPFSYLFGLSCPGCGMTRAFFSLLQLRFAEAFYYTRFFRWSFCSHSDIALCIFESSAFPNEPKGLS